MVKRGPTNKHLAALVSRLEKASRKNNAPVWRRAAELLSRPTRRKPEVNLSKICRYKGTIVVPGKVLSNGNGCKATVAAWNFSAKAREKIEKAGGQAISIEQLLEKNPKGEKLLILV